jgi:hypothetical protein
MAMWRVMAAGLRRVQAGRAESVAMPDHVRRDADQAADGGSGRYSHRSGSGGNDPRKAEKKDEHGFVSRQGGDQSRATGRKDKERQGHDRG